MSPFLDLPITPMLAKLAKDLPTGEGFLFEPKWDGMRCIACKSLGQVELWSRHGRPLDRYFPELVASIRAIPHDFVTDGEIIARGQGGLDFEALLLRLHPAASRVQMLSERTPASFVAFDIIELDGKDLRAEGFESRRGALEQLGLERVPLIELSPVTKDLDQARRWLNSDDTEGVVAKHRTLRYQPGKRAMVKVKKERTADCVVGGFRWHYVEPLVGSLLLGVYDEEHGLIHVGLASAFKAELRRQISETLLPYVCDLEGHPWASGFPLQAGPIEASGGRKQVGRRRRADLGPGSAGACLRGGLRPAGREDLSPPRPLQKVAARP